MKSAYTFILILFLATGKIIGKPKVVISSDFPPIDVIPGSLGTGPLEKRSDPDDIQSVVRFLLSANEFEVAGLIAAAGTLANIANKQHIFDVLDVYDKIDDNLRLHDPAYPTADALKRVTKNGLSGTYARPWQEIIGEGKDSEASEYIISLLKAPDKEPLWFCFWGGTQELAQALWRLSNDPAESKNLDELISKLRVYMIDQQDGSGQWLIDNFPSLFIVVSHNAFKSFSFNSAGADQAVGNLAWLNMNIRKDRGPLGAIYPESGWDHTNKGMIEGDTPSFLYLLSGEIGLSDPEKPWYGGWGGRFKHHPQSKDLWIDADEGGLALILWQHARQNDFANRADWCVKTYKDANHPPVVKLEHASYLPFKPGQKVDLKASATDPDGDKLHYKWWYYKEASTGKENIKINNFNKSKASFIIPTASSIGDSYHIILEVTDSKEIPFTRYKRVIVKVD